MKEHDQTMKNIARYSEDILNNYDAMAERDHGGAGAVIRKPIGRRADVPLW